MMVTEDTEDRRHPIEYIAAVVEILILLISSFVLTVNPSEVVFNRLYIDTGLRLDSGMFATLCVLGMFASIATMIVKDRTLQRVLYAMAPTGLLLYIIPIGYYAGVTGRSGLTWFVNLIIVVLFWIVALSAFRRVCYVVPPADDSVPEQ